MNAPRGAATAATAAKKAAKTPKLAAAASTLGLGLVALVGAAATLLPRHLLDACNWTRHPDVQRAFSTDECYRLLDAAVQAAPKAARREAADVLFHLVESTRREGALWLGLGLGSLYALAVPFDQRHSALFVLAASGSLAALVDASHAGLLGFGATEMLTDRGRSGARVLCAYWLVALPCLWAGCVGSRAKARAKDDLMGRTHTVLRKACSGGNLKIN
mmetsp:Transcript_21657/g.56532  ORF Transcript_21657/g.56532 Transcript_21657/m.56532 type:complete len:218 (+) Transcript_21657:130-783(+)